MPQKKIYATAKLANHNWYVFIFLAAILAYSPFAIDPVLQIRYIVLSVVCLVGLFLLFRKTFSDKKINLIGLPFFILWLIYWCISIVGVLMYGNRSGDAYFVWFQLFLFGAVPFLITTIFFKSGDFIEPILKVFLITGLTAILVGTIQLLKIAVIGRISHASLYEVTSLFAHKNIFAEILLLVFPIAIISTFKLKKIWKLLGYIESILCFVFIIVLLSRAVWLAFASSIGLSIVMLLIFK